jgi:hypothetical protein
MPRPRSSLALRGRRHPDRRRLRRTPVHHHLPRQRPERSNFWPRSIFPIPSARSTPRSPTTWVFAPTAAKARSWAWRPTATTATTWPRCASSSRFTERGFELDLSYFEYFHDRPHRYSEKLVALLGPPREARKRGGQAPRGHRLCPASRDRGGHAAPGAHGAKTDRRQESVRGRRRGAQLRGQRPAPARDRLRKVLLLSSGRRHRHLGGRGLGGRASP